MSSISLRGRFGLNASSQIFAQAVTLGHQVVLVPFFIANWGVRAYSDWIVLSAIPVLLGMLDFGVSNAAANRAIALSSSGDRAGAVACLQSTLAFVIAICALIAGATSATLPLIDPSSILGLNLIDADESRSILASLAGYVCTNLVAQQILAWFKTIDRTPYGTLLLASRRILEICISIYLLQSGHGAVGFALGLVLGQVVYTGFLALWALKLSRMPLLDIRGARWHEIRLLSKPSLGYALFPAVQMATIQAGVLLLNRNAPDQVVAFVMARTLTRVIMQVAGLASAALVPESARLASSGRAEEVEIFTERLAGRVLATAIVSYLTLAVIGPSLIRVWSGKAVELDRFSILIIGLHAVAHAAWVVGASVLLSQNKHLRLAAVYSVFGVLAIALWVACSVVVDPVVGAALILAAPEAAVWVYMRFGRK